jgi:hypothetical protein
MPFDLILGLSALLVLDLRFIRFLNPEIFNPPGFLFVVIVLPFGEDKCRRDWMMLPE